MKFSAILALLFIFPPTVILNAALPSPTTDGLVWQSMTPSSVSSVVIPNNASLVLAGGSGFVSLYKLGESSPVWTFTGYRINVVTTSIDGKLLAAGSEESRVFVFGQTSSHPLRGYLTDGSVLSIVASTSRVFAGTFFGTIYAFDPEREKSVWSIQEDFSILALDVSNDGQSLVAGTYDGRILLINAHNGLVAWAYRAEGYVRAISISGDGSRIVAGTNDGAIIILRTQEAKAQLVLKGLGPIRTISATKSGSSLGLAADDKRIYLLDLERISVLSTFDIDAAATSSAFSPDGSYLIVGTSGGAGYLFNTRPPRLEATYKPGFEIASVSVGGETPHLVLAGGPQITVYRPPLAQVGYETTYVYSGLFVLFLLAVGLTVLWIRVWRKNPSSGVSFSNAAFCRALGRTRSRLLRLSWGRSQRIQVWAPDSFPM